ncbi:MAG: pyruvate dehydrogenase complex dihydrolipoamide acetyltransferase [Myxococcota bacterium]
MAKILGLPKLSPTMEEGTLVSWEKKEGDAIDVDDLLAEVETDKATMEFRSFDKGTLLKILVDEGATLEPDMPVAILGDPGEDITALIEEAKTMGASGGANGAPAPEPAASEPAPAAPVEAPAATPTAATVSRVEPGGRILASPLVRKLSREQGIDLAMVTGTGPHGRIIKRDLDGYQPTSSPGPTTALIAPRETRIEKVSQMRKTIARRLTESKRDVPHYYLTIDVDMEPLMAARKAINAELEKSGQKVSVNDLLIKGCATALRRHPNVNASFRGDTIHYHGRVDISVAVAIPDGLITPVVRNADLKGLAEISTEVRELAGRAREKRLQPEEFTDGTFSISNLGMFGIEYFTAVINPPEGAILAVGTIRDEPVIKGGALVPGKRMRMTMSCDHRVIDGAVGAEFLATLKRLLEAPASMLI